jgi:hypothetical protein
MTADVQHQRLVVAARDFAFAFSVSLRIYLFDTENGDFKNDCARSSRIATDQN